MDLGILHVARRWRCGCLRAAVGQPEVHVVDGAYQPHRFQGVPYHQTSHGHATEAAIKVATCKGYQYPCSATGGRAGVVWLWTAASACRASVGRCTAEQW